MSKQWDEELYKAAGCGDVGAIEKLVEQGAKVNWRNPDQGGRTPLHEAASHGTVKGVRVLLASGALIKAKDDNGRTALHEAVLSFWPPTSVVRELLEAGALIEAKDDNGSTPLHEAARGGTVEAVLALLEAGALTEAKDNGGCTPLHEAARRGILEAVRALLEAGALTEAKHKNGCTPLHEAAREGRVEAVRALLEAGALTEAKNNVAETPLHWATSWGHAELTRVLLDAGADMAVRNVDGRTPLDANVVGSKLAVWIFGWGSQKKAASIAAVNEVIQAAVVARKQEKQERQERDSVGAGCSQLGALWLPQQQQEEEVPGSEDQLEGMQDELQQLFRFMHGKDDRSTCGRAAQAPTIVMPRSQIKMPANAPAIGDSRAFGTVFKAIRDGGEVAIKVYNHRKLGELDSEEALEEALLLRKANHHNVVRCYGIVHDPDTAEGGSLHGSLVMEWVGGGNMYMWLQSHRAVTLPQRLQLAQQVAAGMQHLHDRGLVHGDLEPRNVMLTPLLPGMDIPQAKIRDFGLAKHTSTSLQHTHQENKVYTPAYTSPERIDDFHPTREDDVYAFGILLYFIMTGSTPFSHVPAIRLEAAIQRGVRPDMGAWVDRHGRASNSGPILQQVAAGVASLAAQCWSGEARQRPTIEGVHANLSAMLARLGTC